MGNKIFLSYKQNVSIQQMGNCTEKDITLGNLSSLIHQVNEDNLVILKGLLYHFLNSNSKGMALRLLKIYDLSRVHYAHSDQKKQVFVRIEDWLEYSDQGLLESLLMGEYLQSKHSRAELLKIYKQVAGSFLTPSIKSIDQACSSESSPLMLTLQKEYRRSQVQKNFDDVVTKVNRGQKMTDEQNQLIREVCELTTFIYSNRTRRVDYPSASSMARSRMSSIKRSRSEMMRESDTNIESIQDSQEIGAHEKSYKSQESRWSQVPSSQQQIKFMRKFYNQIRDHQPSRLRSFSISPKHQQSPEHFPGPNPRVQSANNMGTMFAKEAKKKVSMVDFEIKRLIGKGRFGKVYQVIHTPSACTYAMKILKKSVMKETNQQKQAILERNILSQVHHPFLIRMQYAFQSANKLCLVLDLANGGELFNHLRKVERFDERAVVFFGAEVVSALEYLHANLIVYKDLKPENILLDDLGHVRLTDFGLAYYKYEATNLVAGTSAYLPPEIILEEQGGAEVDVWTFGILLFELATGTTPFYHKNRIQMFKRILATEASYPGFLSEGLVDLIGRLLRKNPSDRLRISEIKDHDFFREVDWGAVEAGLIEPPYNPHAALSGGENHYRELYDSSPPGCSPNEMRKMSFASYPDFDFVLDEGQTKS